MVGLERYRLALCGPIQTVAGAEGRSFRPQEDHLDGGIPVGAVESSVQLFNQSRRDGVVLVGPVEDDGAYAVAGLGAECLAHR
jgi:hypothetical protein